MYLLSCDAAGPAVRCQFVYWVMSVASNWPTAWLINHNYNMYVFMYIRQRIQAADRVTTWHFKDIRLQLWKNHLYRDYFVFHCDTRFLWLAQRETSWSWWRVCVRGWRTMVSAQILPQTGSLTSGSSLAAVRPWIFQRPRWTPELQPVWSLQ